MDNGKPAKSQAGRYIFDEKNKTWTTRRFFYFSLSRHIRSFINIIDAPLEDSAAATLRAIILSSWLGGRANRWTGFPAHAHRLTGFRWPVTTQRSVVHHPQLGALISNSVCPDPQCNFQFHFEISGLTFVFFFFFGRQQTTCCQLLSQHNRNSSCVLRKKSHTSHITRKTIELSSG